MIESRKLRDPSSKGLTEHVHKDSNLVPLNISGLASIFMSQRCSNINTYSLLKYYLILAFSTFEVLRESITQPCSQALRLHPCVLSITVWCIKSAAYIPILEVLSGSYIPVITLETGNTSTAGGYESNILLISVIGSESQMVPLNNYRLLKRKLFTI